MAEKLKREFDLIVLKVELLFSSCSPNKVQFTLQCKEEGQLKDAWTEFGNTAQMGLSETRRERSRKCAKLDAKLPPPLIERLQSWFQFETNGDRPLWIHLVAPYGALRFLPWEQILGQALQLPILMLPDFIFPPPRETADVLEIVLCASAPLGCEDADICRTLQTTAARIIESQVRRMRLHVFVDRANRTIFQSFAQQAGWGEDLVVLYAHETAAKYVADNLPSELSTNASVLRSPWLLWMRDALRGSAVDVVHFICHGYLAQDKGAILFAQSPLERTSRYLAGPAGFAELQTFLTQVGAWSAAFSSVPNNFSETGLRALGDEIAQNRPGPMMIQNSALDPAGSTIAQAYRFLYNPSPPTAPPRSPALFIYCQPYLAARQTSRPAIGQGPRRGPRAFRSPVNLLMEERARNSVQETSIAQSESSHSPLENFFQGQENPTPLAAATERFAEQIELRYQKMARDDIFSRDIGERQCKSVSDVLERIRSAVAAQIKPSNSEAPPPPPNANHSTAEEAQ